MKLRCNFRMDPDKDPNWICGMPSAFLALEHSFDKQMIIRSQPLCKKHSREAGHAMLVKIE